MRVMLVNPPARRPLPSILPSEVEGSRGFFPPLGILYLAASIREIPGVKVSLIDAQAEGLSADDVARRAREFDPDVVGITVLTFTLRDALDTAMAVKAMNPKIKVIAGGPHPHIFPDETLGLGPFDAVLRGEGEESFPAYLTGMSDNDGTTPPGVIPRSGQRGEPDIAPFIDDLDLLPFPARDLSKIEIYHSVLSGRRPITTMMSSRGCPYRCVFCDRPHLGKKFRKRRARNVVDEMAECVELGIREIVFYDDTFTVDKDRVREIAELLMEGRVRIPWDIRARVSDLKKSDYELCKRAGLARVHFGVESGDPKILESIGKGITVEQAETAFKAARQAGIETLAYFMVGLPGETEESLQKTLALAKKLDPDYVHFSALIPFPGTPLYRDGLAKGIIGRDVWADFAKDPAAEFTPPVWEESLTKEEILSALARMYREFYRQPRVLLRRLKRVRNIEGLMRGVRLGSKILFMKGSR